MATRINPTHGEGLESASEMCSLLGMEDMNKSKESQDEFIFYYEEAGIVDKFFEEELLSLANDFGGNLSREPALGQPERVTITCMKEKHVKDLQRSIEKIREKMNQYYKESVEYESNFLKADEFVKQSRENSSTLVYLDTRNMQVCVVGTQYEDFKSEVHKLKVIEEEREREKKKKE